MNHGRYSKLSILKFTRNKNKIFKSFEFLNSKIRNFYIQFFYGQSYE